MHPLAAYLRSSPYSSETLAEKIGIPRSVLYRIMNGEGCTLRVAQLIVEATEGAVTLDDLAKGLKERSVWGWRNVIRHTKQHTT